MQKIASSVRDVVKFKPFPFKGVLKEEGPGDAAPGFLMSSGQCLPEAAKTEALEPWKSQKREGSQLAEHRNGSP